MPLCFHRLFMLSLLPAFACTVKRSVQIRHQATLLILSCSHSTTSNSKQSRAFFCAAFCWIKRNIADCRQGIVSGSLEVVCFQQVMMTRRVSLGADSALLSGKYRLLPVWARIHKSLLCLNCSCMKKISDGSVYNLRSRVTIGRTAF